MRPTTRTSLCSSPWSPRGRTGAGLAVVTLCLLVGAVACSSSDTPDAGATSTTAAADGGTGDAGGAGAGDGSTSTSTRPDDGGDATSSTAVEPAEHGPLPSVDLDEDEQAFVDALMQEPPPNMDAEQAECIAGHWIQAVGVEAVEAAGVTPEAIEAGTSSISDIPVDQATAEKVVDSYEQCDFDLTDLVVTGFAGSVGGDPVKLECIEGVVTPELARAYMIAALMATDTGGTDLVEIQRVIEPCLT